MPCRMRGFTQARSAKRWRCPLDPGLPRLIPPTPTACSQPAAELLTAGLAEVRWVELSRLQEFPPGLFRPVLMYLQHEAAA
jgi:hypothetical protein